MCASKCVWILNIIYIYHQVQAAYSLKGTDCCFSFLRAKKKQQHWFTNQPSPSQTASQIMWFPYTRHQGRQRGQWYSSVAALTPAFARSDRETVGVVCSVNKMRINTERRKGSEQVQKTVALISLLHWHSCRGTSFSDVWSQTDFLRLTPISVFSLSCITVVYMTKPQKLNVISCQAKTMFRTETGRNWGQWETEVHGSIDSGAHCRDGGRRRHHT